MTQLNSGITALETRYAGYRFRSRIEARWAVFFTRLAWTGSTSRRASWSAVASWPICPTSTYPRRPCTSRSNPHSPTRSTPRASPLGAVRRRGRHHLADGPGRIFCGQIPDPEKVTESGPPWSGRWYDDGIYITGDCNYSWCACPSGEHFDIQFEGRGGRILCGCKRALDDRYHTGNDRRIINAYGAARSARFEHGEAGA
jgi:hypothetical protein